jgi:hypothetical protein
MRHASTSTAGGPGPWQPGGHGGRRAAATWPAIGAAAEAAVSAEPEPPPAPTTIVFDESDLARAMAAAAATAREAARQAAEAESAARVAAALEVIAGGLDGADAVLARRKQQFREAAAQLAALAAEAIGTGNGKLARRLADALTADCLSRFEPTLALTIEVAPELADPLAALLEASPVVRSRPGRVAVEPVATLAPGEARLVWTDGRADWSIERITKAAAELIRRLTDPEDARARPPAVPAATEGAETP